MPRKVKEVLTVVDADAPWQEEEATEPEVTATPDSKAVNDVTATPDSKAVKSEEVESPPPAAVGARSAAAEQETHVGFIPEVPWQEVVPKRRGGRQKSEQTVDLKAKTRCEACGRQMCSYTEVQAQVPETNPGERCGTSARTSRAGAPRAPTDLHPAGPAHGESATPAEAPRGEPRRTHPAIRWCLSKEQCHRSSDASPIVSERAA